MVARPILMIFTAFALAALFMQTRELPMSNDLSKRLTPLQFQVTQQQGTEPPFQNEYWNEKRRGLYVDIVSGHPLFSSQDKFDSGCGWPSFSKPIAGAPIEEKTDKSHGMSRTEVRSVDSHLGHVFDDGPLDKGGLRYCINSASIQFIPEESLGKEGYDWARPLLTGEKATADIAVMAGGCFWGMEELLRQQSGVINTEVGYTGGHEKYATYKSHGGHAEAILIRFDPTKTSYETLLAFFFTMHDPTTPNRQGNDIGESYRSAIFYQNAAQKALAEKVKKEVNQSGKWKSPIVTEIAPLGAWWQAEDYHQDYLQKNPGGYTCHFIRK